MRYDPDGRLPPEAATAQVFVPPFLASARVVDLVERLPELRLVQLLTAGAENWVGRLPAHVALSDCRGAHGGATAEWIVAVLLAVYRELPGFVRSQDARRWDQHFTDELAGKRVLLVGAGDLAENTARRLAPFEVTTTLVGRRARDGVHGIAEVHELLPDHDVAVLDGPADRRHPRAGRRRVPRRDARRRPAGQRRARPGRRHRRAESPSCRPAGCGPPLDVTDPEPLPADHPLWTAPGLLLTPHVGGSVPGGMRRAFGDRRRSRSGRSCGATRRRTWSRTDTRTSGPLRCGHQGGEGEP